MNAVAKSYMYYTFLVTYVPRALWLKPIVCDLIGAESSECSACSSEST